MSEVPVKPVPVKPVVSVLSAKIAAATPAPAPVDPILLALRRAQMFLGSAKALAASLADLDEETKAFIRAQQEFQAVKGL